MIVTQISGITKGRCRIYIEEKPAFVLYKGEMKRLGIREGEPLPEESLREIQEEILPGRAKRRAMNLLQSRDYTESGLREKLRSGDYPEDCIEEALAYVKSYGYVDDRRYAEDFISYNLDRKSRTRMEQDLLRKGISKDMICAAFEALDEQGTRQDEGAMIRSLLEKKKYDPKTATRQEKQRMYAFLYRRGFHCEAINGALLLDIT
ncbi:MAG: recombination regulator RecX [Lachnospiraceae bacterium]|nr:recombination regulator RecX [Lachnospiraceae bacterium]